MTHDELRSKAAQALASIECKTQAPCTTDPERCECWTQARAVLAVVYSEALTWPTPEMFADSGTIRLREYPSSSLLQLLPSSLASRGADVINEAPNGRCTLPGAGQ